MKSLGNHELDEGVDGLIPFIKNLTSPVLAANLLLQNVPELERETNLYKSIVLKVKGTEIGIIGYLTPETKFLAPKNKIDYEDEVIAIRREVKLLEEKGVKIIIAIGHSGFVKDLQIAQEVDGLDLVIGGHSNTFLLNSNYTNEIPEYPQGLYPTIIKQNSGRSVLVVQAYAYTKYMGKLYLNFDVNGEIIHYSGDPLLLSQNIPEDPHVLEKINLYRQDIDRIYNKVVGSSQTFLDGDQCRLRECNLGNFISDAIINYTLEYYKEHFDVKISITQGGRIRTSLDRAEKPFQLTRGDWITVIPFTDTLCILSMNGTILMQALEHSVSGWRKIDAPGQFLQFSGMEVVYDISRKRGSRVVKGRAICTNCSGLNEISDKLEYKIITSLFIADGGDGYAMFPNLPREILEYNEITCILNYTIKYSPINPQVANRITILNENVAVTESRIANSRAKSTHILNQLIVVTSAFLLLYKV